MNIDAKAWRDLLGQLEGLRSYYERLTERERYIVLGSVAAGVLVLMFTVYMALAASTSGLSNRIEKARKNLHQIEDIRSTYLQTERQIRDLERTIQRTPPSFRLATHLEKVATKYGVKIDSVKDRPGPAHELYREIQAAVTVKQITLKTLISFLFDIENSRELLRISSLQVKPNFQDPTHLNVTFVVSTFQPSERS